MARNIDREAKGMAQMLNMMADENTNAINYSQLDASEMMISQRGRTTRSEVFFQINS